MSSSAVKSTPLLNKIDTPLHGIYIPCALLIVGTAIVKREWLMYSVMLALWLTAMKVMRGRPRSVLQADQYRRFELISKTTISHNTAIYRFGLPHKTDKLGLPIGQHISIAATINDKEIVRSYTPISSDDEDSGYFDLLIKSYPTGNISKHIASLRIGQSISVKGPKGQMKYERGLVQEFGMIAGGSGITPMLQIVKAILRDQRDTTKVSLIFANVNEEDILLREDLDALAAKNPQFSVYYVLNNPPEGWQGGVGFVTADMIKERCPGPEMGANAKILICGPPPMVSAMKKATASLGYEAAKPVSKIDHQVFAF